MQAARTKDLPTFSLSWKVRPSFFLLLGRSRTQRVIPIQTGPLSRSPFRRAGVRACRLPEGRGEGEKNPFLREEKKIRPVEGGGKGEEASPHKYAGREGGGNGERLLSSPPPSPPPPFAKEAPSFNGGGGGERNGWRSLLVWALSLRAFANSTEEREGSCQSRERFS